MQAKKIVDTQAVEYSAARLRLSSLKEVQPQSDEARVLAAAERRRMVAAVLLRLDQHGCQAEPTLCSAAATLTDHGRQGFSRRIPASVRPELPSVLQASRL